MAKTKTITMLNEESSKIHDPPKFKPKCGVCAVLGKPCKRHRK